MLFPLLLIGVGFIAASRGKPKSAVRQTPAFGPKSGLQYQIEELTEVGVAIVRGPGSTVMGLKKASVVGPGPNGESVKNEWHHIRSAGNPEVLEAMKLDFDVKFPALKPKAVDE